MEKIELFLLGIGTGNPEHVTRQAEHMLRTADIIMVPHKGKAKRDLADLRYQICLTLLGAEMPPVFEFALPEREAGKPYLVAVDDWHDAIANIWTQTIQTAKIRSGQSVQRVALLIWGDPCLYDSSLRIAARLKPAPKVTVVPGITAVQALTAAHKIPLNTLGGAFIVTTGRRLSEQGLPPEVDTAVIMLDGQAAFNQLNRANFDIWWGAYLGMPEQLLISGHLCDVADEILERRAKARAAQGWIMDTYLLRRRSKKEQGKG